MSVWTALERQATRQCRRVDTRHKDRGSEMLKTRSDLLPCKTCADELMKYGHKSKTDSSKNVLDESGHRHSVMRRCNHQLPLTLIDRTRKTPITHTGCKVR